MALHLWCIVAAWILVYSSKLPVAVAMQRAGGYDNRHPRAQQATLTGWGARSVATHLNGFETFAPFAAAVLVAHLAGGLRGLMGRTGDRLRRLPRPVPDLLPGGSATLRSIVWSVGWLATLALFLSPPV